MSIFAFSLSRKFRRPNWGGKAARLFLVAVLGCLLTPPLGDPGLARGAKLSTPRSVAATAEIAERARAAYGQLPLSFEANRGQTDPRVEFIARGGRFNLFLTASEAVLQLRAKEIVNPKPELGDLKSETGNLKLATLRLRWAGANPAARIEGLEELPGTSNYLTGADPSAWRVNVPHYAKARCRDLYPGIDLVYYGNRGQLEYDLVVAPGADPRVARLVVAGARSLRIEAGGDLTLGTAAGEARFKRPVVYQMIDGERRLVDGRYVRRGAREIGFALGDYDRRRELIIDPLLDYVSLFGGDLNDQINAIAVDRDGNAYVTGNGLSLNFPTTTGAFQRNYNGGPSDAFALKLNAGGSARVYATYLGGSSAEVGLGIAVDEAGAAYVTGETASFNFPLTPGSYRSPNLLGSSAFITKLNVAGSALVYSALLGGEDNDAGFSIAVDRQGQAYVTGRTRSFEFPRTPGAFQTGRFFGTDGFVTKFNANGTALVYSTLVAGNSDEIGNAIALDAENNVYVTGATRSADFPTTAGAFQRTASVGLDAFALKLNPAGAAAVYSTFLGANGDDLGQAIAVDAAGQAYVTGQTTSSAFPTTPGSFQRSGSRGSDVFVTKLNAAGGALVYSTYLAGIGDESGNGIAVDGGGNAYVAGATASNDFPTTPNAFQPRFNQLAEGFITKLNATGAALLYSTYLSGRGDEQATSMARDREGKIYVAGRALVSDFSATPGAYRTTGGTAFIFKLSLTTPAAVNAASFAASALATESIAAAFGVSLATGTEAAASLPLPTTLAGTRVAVRDSAGIERAAALFFVSPGQVNFQVPPETAAGPATLTITSGDGSVATTTTMIAAVVPGLFSANADGQGVAAGVALRIRANGSQSFEPLSQFDAGQNRFVPVPLDLGPEGEQVFLILFGTGLRKLSSPAAVTATVGGENAELLFAGPQGDFVGLDQVNLRVPRTLVGRGQADVSLTVDGQLSNTINLTIR